MSAPDCGQIENYEAQIEMEHMEAQMSNRAFFEVVVGEEVGAATSPPSSHAYDNEQRQLGNRHSPVFCEEIVPGTSVIRDAPPPLTTSNVETQSTSGERTICCGGMPCGIPCSRFFKRKNRASYKIAGKSKSQVPRSVRSYYRKMEEIQSMHKNTAAIGTTDLGTASRDDSKAGILAKVSFFTNLLLVVIKAVAAALSGSLSVISSLVDSVMDLVSGVIIWITSSKMKTRLPYNYPSGRARLEPVAIVILSAVMSVASVQLIAESVQNIISLAKGTYPGIDFSNITIGVLAATMLVKAVLWILCRGSTSPSVKALSLDHRNDVLSNMVAALCGYFGHAYWAYLDPLGAMLISIYILVNWWIAGSEQIKLLTGHTADPEFLNKVTWISIEHDERIKQIDTVRAYHFGNDFIVEVHIVLPEEMSLKEAHDIGEPLQNKLEALAQVERAFVHIDYESEHAPQTEHKVL